MKKNLLLMRHGEAKDAAPGESDYERHLTTNGHTVVRAQGERLVERDLWPGVVLCSSAVRTRQTADLLLMALAGEREPLIENRTDLYHATPEDIIHMIRAQEPHHNCVMVVGHNPVIHQLGLSLLAPGEKNRNSSLKNKFAPATCAVLQFDLHTWGELALHKAILADLLLPTP